MSNEHIHCGEHIDCASCGQGCDVRTQAMELLKQMAAQNAKRANELSVLATRFDELKETTAAEQLRHAVGDYEKGNLRLQTVLSALEH